MKKIFFAIIATVLLLTSCSSRHEKTMRTAGAAIRPHLRGFENSLKERNLSLRLFGNSLNVFKEAKLVDSTPMSTGYYIAPKYAFESSIFQNAEVLDCPEVSLIRLISDVKNGELDSLGVKKCILFKYQDNTYMITCTRDEINNNVYLCARKFDALHKETLKAPTQLLVRN